MLELLEECSRRLSGGRKTYQTLFTLDGKPVRSLDEIPPDCKLLMASEQSPPVAEREEVMEQYTVPGVPDRCRSPSKKARAQEEAYESYPAHPVAVGL